MISLTLHTAQSVGIWMGAMWVLLLSREASSLLLPSRVFLTLVSGVRVGLQGFRYKLGHRHPPVTQAGTCVSPWPSPFPLCPSWHPILLTLSPKCLLNPCRVILWAREALVPQRPPDLAFRWKRALPHPSPEAGVGGQKLFLLQLLFFQSPQGSLFINKSNKVHVGTYTLSLTRPCPTSTLCQHEGNHQVEPST